MNTDEVSITRLLIAARNYGIGRMQGLPATRHNMDSLASEVRGEVLRQAERGTWAPWGAVNRAAVEGLVITARHGRALFNEPPIVLDWDWSQTAIPSLLVTNLCRGSMT